MDSLKEVIYKHSYYCNDIKSYAVPVSVLEDFIKRGKVIEELIQSMQDLGKETQKLKEVINVNITRDTD